MHEEVVVADLAPTSTLLGSLHGEGAEPVGQDRQHLAAVGVDEPGALRLGGEQRLGDVGLVALPEVLLAAVAGS